MNIYDLKKSYEQVKGVRSEINDAETKLRD